jgi:ligand-binding SRPBCC domain-containing protein
MHTLKQSQTLPISRKVLWDFVSVPQNLNKITPPKMAFKIVGESPKAAFSGLLLEYKVKIPILGWTSWLTEIKYVKEGFSFMDEQRVGPYKLWLHTHSLEDVEGGGTKMTDEIRYQMPRGIFGAIAHVLFVKRTLSQIFEYRREKLNELFPSNDSTSS